MAESTGAILTAAGANLAIAVAKFGGAALTGSSSMLAEGVHSVVDTLNQALLLLGLKRAARPASAKHPFGYGREVYFYSFVVALLIFGAGGVFSIYEGIDKVLHPEAESTVAMLGLKVPGFAINVAILAFATLAEGTSFVVAYRGLPRRDASPLSTIRRSKDPSLFVVLVEDAAAVAGLVIALAGVTLSQALAMPALDGAASIGIGLVLIGMATFLMVETHGLLIGEAADPDLVAAIEEVVRGKAAVRHVNEILTQHLGPSDILVNISLDIAGALSGREVEDLVAEFDACLKDRYASVRRVFIEMQSQESSKARRPGA